MPMGLGLEILTIGGIVFCLLSLYWSILSYRRHKTNLFVAQELQKIIDDTATAIHQKKGPVEGIPNEIGTGSGEMLDSPELLSTLLTVLINKFGDVRLSMTDFMLADEEYVSVYVDTTSQEILLSMKQSLSDEEPLIGFYKSDDQTFH